MAIISYGAYLRLIGAIIITSLTKNISVKIVSPNFSLKDYTTKSEEFQIETTYYKLVIPKKIKKLYLFGRKEYFISHIYKTYRTIVPRFIQK